MVIIGLIILAAAVVAAVAGVFGNTGAAHALGKFAVFGHHVTGSTGTLFLCGIVVGVVGMIGLSLLLAGGRNRTRVITRRPLFGGRPLIGRPSRSAPPSFRAQLGTAPLCRRAPAQ